MQAPFLEHIGRIRETLRSGTLVDDRLFDDVYPLHIRRASSIHWTPVEVAVRAAKLLAIEPGARILDIGSGVGKFCIVAAAAVDARVHGIEHRPHLVAIAERAAARVGVEVTFRTRTFAPEDAEGVDGIYLFNPFAENVCSSADSIDVTVERSFARFERDIATAEELFRQARVGARVVTYCGFGGRLPAGYTLATRDRCAGMIELWVKTGRGGRRTSERRKPGKPRGVVTASSVSELAGVATAEAAEAAEAAKAPPSGVRPSARRCPADSGTSPDPRSS